MRNSKCTSLKFVLSFYVLVSFCNSIYYIMLPKRAYHALTHVLFDIGLNTYALTNVYLTPDKKTY